MSEIRKVILLLATSRAHVRGLLHGIARYSRVHGPWIFYTDASLHGKRDALSWLKGCGADGVIAPDAAENKEIIEMGLPTIIYRVAEKRTPNMPAIVADNRMIGKMAAEHLLNCGFGDFAFCGFKSRPWSRQRKDSFTGRLAEAGLTPGIFDTTSDLGSWRSFEREQNRLIGWLKSLPKPVGLMAGNDVCGRYVIEACRLAGLRIPDEVAVVGVDNDELICDLTDPPMSSIALNTEKAGYEAAELLDRLIAGEKTADRDIIVRATHITTRQSTDILAVEDKNVAEAIRFICQHAREAIQVSNVVDHMAMSRRSLEQRFRRVLGRSIYNEIKRVRTQQIIRMLCETDLSVSDIALKLGHLSSKHIARYFKQQTGVSLRQYRKQYRK